MQMNSGSLSQVISDAFDLECQRKHDEGSKKYGAVRFMDVDSIAMAMDEVIDLSNYSRFIYVKLAMLQSFALTYEGQIGQFLRFKEEFALFMKDKGIDINEAPPAIEPPNGADTAIDTGVPYVETNENTGFFNPFRKQS